MTAPMRRHGGVPIVLGGVAFAVVVGGCIEAVVPPSDPVECAVTADCRTDQGEICSEGVCWGDPPAAMFAGVLGPGPAYNSVATTTEIAALYFSSDGWFGDGQSGGITLASAIRVSGQVRAACPAALDTCTGFFAVPGQIRWSRASSIPGLPDVTVSTTMSGINGNGTATGFEVFLPRPTATTLYTVTFNPSTAPLGAGLPSPASLLPPHRVMVTVGPTDQGGLVRDFMLPTGVRTISGRVSLVSAVTLAGWRVHAEAGDGTVQGSLLLASNIATTSTSGDFSLAIGDGVDLVDLVFSPANVPGGGEALPRVRLRDHVVTSPLATVALPKLERIIAAPVVVEGTDSGGGQTGVIGASVIGRLDQPIGAVYLQHEVTTTTATSGLGSLQVLLGTAALPLHYELDVLPGPTSEMASVYGLDLDVGDTVPSPTVRLARVEAQVGTVIDENGFGLPGATVTASVSADSLCELSSDSLRVARGLAPVQAATDDRGEFTLYLDPEFDGTTLTYDITIEPAGGTWAPRWTFQAQPLTSEHRSLWLPPAAHVRSQVFDPGANPAPDTVVTLYELTGKPSPCPQVSLGESGLSVRRAVGTTDDDGIVRLILPRVGLE